MAKMKSQKKDNTQNHVDKKTKNNKNHPTLSVPLSSLHKHITSGYTAISRSPHGWYFVAFGLLCLYMLIFQLRFILSGDIWAEAFPEYVNEAVTLHWGEVLQPSWAGYLTIIPSFLSKLYVAIGLPLGYIDHYLRAATLLFAISCVSFIAHPINRKLIPHDLLRVGIAFIFMLSLMQVSVLAFINIWYAGFVIVALISLSGKRLSTKWNVIYTLFAIAVILSKSSLVLLPFVVYRALSTKRYYQGALLSIAVLFQTYLTVFAANGYGGDKLNANVFEIGRDLLLGASVQVFKLIHFPFINHATIIIGLLALAGIAIILWIRKGWLITTTMGLSLAISLYLHIFAPDNNFKNVWSSYSNLYADTSKLQREFFISFLLLLLIGMILSLVWRRFSKMSQYNSLSRFAIVGCLLLIIVAMNPLHKIDISSPGVSTDISSFRSSLNNGRSVCVPVPPTPLIDYHATWFFQYKGGCYLFQKAEPFSLKSLHHTITSSGVPLVVDATQKENLKTILMPIAKVPFTDTSLTLTDVQTHKQSTVVVPNNEQDIVFVSFNLESLSLPRGPRNIMLQSHSPNGEPHMGSFISGKPLFYAYFIGEP